VIAFVATLGLVALTIAAVARPAADVNIWYVGTMALAWVAVLASSLAMRDRAWSKDEQNDPGESDSRESDSRENDSREHDQRERPRTVTKAAPAVDAPAQSVPGESLALLDFARELHGTLESDRLRLLISRRLPALLGLRDVWIVARFGARQQIIVPPGSDEGAMLSDEPRQWSTYPMKTDDRTIGVLGAALPAAGFTERDHRQLKTVASLVAQALSTADAFETLRETSLVDPLTGCATRVEGGRRFEAELRRAHRSEGSIAILMLDLDHFKSVNDRFGHKAGDTVLSAIGETLQTTLRASDVRCRWGGEEFLLVLPDSTVERAQRASENLRQRIANTPVAIGDRVINVTASIGLTLSLPRETDTQQLLARADAALYEAKRVGRNCVATVLPGVRARGREARPPGAAPTPPPPPGPATADRRAEAPVREPQVVPWNGIERRDPARRDRRRVPSPGRRSTDGVLAGRWQR